jgi:anti-sigma B factor antagonist
MRITERATSNVAVLDLRGTFSGRRAATRFLEAVRRQCRNGIGIIVANLSDVPKVGLEGLSAFIDAHADVRQVGGRFCLTGVTKRIDDLVVITRLLTLFDTFDSVDDAVGGTMAAPAPTSFGSSVLSLAAIHKLLRRV